MREFSRRTVERLRAALPLRLALPALEPFLAGNVEKEIRKDALVIRRAGAPPAATEVPEILAAAREIDREFLRRVDALPVRIEIPYASIEPVRARRVELGLDTARCILATWSRGQRLRRGFAPGELERRLRAMLELYAEETHALSHSVRLPGVLAPLRERIAQRLREAMRDAAHGLAAGAHATRQRG